MSESVNTPADPNEEPKKELKDQKFSYFEPIAGMIVAIVCVIIFLGFPQIITIGFIGTPPRLIPTFDADVIRSLWFPIILWGLLHIGVDVAYLIERRYTKRLAMITVIGHALALICACIIFIPSKIVYWEYLVWVDILFEHVADWFGNILAIPNLIVLFLMIIVSLFVSITVVRKGNKAKEKEDDGSKEEANA